MLVVDGERPSRSEASVSLRFLKMEIYMDLVVTHGGRVGLGESHPLLRNKEVGVWAEAETSSLPEGGSLAEHVPWATCHVISCNPHLHLS